MLADRTKTILKAAVEDYIETGKPITSDALYKAHDFGIKPAMIRWELNELNELGFLSQKHPSGGRIPTDKAYKFLIASLEKELADVREKQKPALADNFAQSNFRDFVFALANELNLLSIGYETQQSAFYESGLDELLGSLEDTTRDELVSIVRDFENLPDRLAWLCGTWAAEEMWPRIFIGRNPLIKSKHVAMIASCLAREDDKYFVLAIGPKRMDYDKSLRIFRSLG
jgi:transcriptional regulator of heat shock response